MEFSSIIGIHLAVLAVLIGPVAWAMRTSRKETIEEEKKFAARKEALRTFVPRQFAALTNQPPRRCGHAPDVPLQLPMDTSLQSYPKDYCVWEIWLNNEVVHSAFTNILVAFQRKKVRSLEDVESVARRYPKQEWLVVLHDAMQSLYYQRHAEGQWNLVKVGNGIF